jgi:hypothetical protein
MLPNRPGVVRVVLGDDVLLVEADREFVLDVLRDALRAP